jgi:hypothetical protein
MSVSRLAIERAITGVELPHDQPIRCCECGTRLREGALVTVAATEHDGGVWRLGDVWCAGDGPVPWDHDADADADVLAEGSLGLASDSRDQRHYPILVRAAVLNGEQVVRA